MREESASPDRLLRPFRGSRLRSDRWGRRLLVMVTIAGWVSLRITPIYEAMARVSIFGQTSNFLNFSDKSQFSDAGGDQFSIDTQVKILQSNTLALLVIRNLGLDKRPEFAGPAASEAKPGVVSQLSQQNLGRE